MHCSVIVPLYNKAATVIRTLESIRAQTLAGFEVILVDDGSTDRSTAVVQEYLGRIADPRIRLVQQTNAGPGAARNRGISEARYPLVAFLDADDEWLPEFLQLTTAALAEHPEAAAVSTGWFDIFTQTAERHSSRGHFQRVGLRTGLYRVTAETDPHQVVALNILMSPCSTVARKEIVQQMGGFYEHGARFGEDSYLWLKLLLNHPVQLLEQEGAVFHREASELSGNYRGMRPLEPFLLDPDGVRKDCPEAVRPVLDRVLAIRAMKTSCVLSYWGHWRQARMLRRQYRVPEAWRLNWYVPSLLAATPLGSLAGAGVRALRGPR